MLARTGSAPRACRAQMVLVNISASLIITSIIKSAPVLTSLINKRMKAQERERDVFKVTELGQLQTPPAY